ncbi:hypothetical protein DHEL01_v212321 [Diaporthe helianthi]|uniref:Uncharacterized protein n=1 Tax=Diaporthe helianthi TaxID=158607 RepID=A0A2P5HGB5_DIAHE|nr:hypothetical protein DHEL01_v212321 [Diaporthe helianthi]
MQPLGAETLLLSCNSFVQQLAVPGCLPPKDMQGPTLFTTGEADELLREKVWSLRLCTMSRVLQSQLYSLSAMKRRRLDSPKLESSTSESTVPPSLKAMRALFDHSFASFKQELKLELRQELRQDFEDILAAHKQDVAEMLQQTEARIVSMVRSEFGGHWMEMEQPMTYRVPEEMAETREEIMENITEQQLTATLNFTHHPLY